MNVKNILSLIDSMMDEFPAAERRIARTILAEPEKVVYMTAAEIGRAANASAATVIRFCRRIHVGSFTDLKILISRDLDQTTPTRYVDLRPDESPASLIQNMTNNSILAMEDTASTLSAEALGRAVSVIEEADTLYAFGVGASHLAAQNIAHKWSRIGKVSIAMSDPHLLLAALAAGDQKKALIVISNSGETSEVLRVNKIARRKGIKTIGMTRFGHSTLSAEADVSLQHARTNESQLRSAATSSLHAQFLVVDSLFYLYASKNFDEALDAIQNSRAEIANYNAHS